MLRRWQGVGRWVAVLLGTSLLASCGEPDGGDGAIADVPSATEIAAGADGQPGGDQNTTGNSAPTAAITAPLAGATFDAGALISFSATASDAEDNTAALSVSWRSSLDGPLATELSFETAALSPGAHAITLTVTDTGGAVAEDEIAIEVRQAPDAPIVTIEPVEPKTGDSLSAVVVDARPGAGAAPVPDAYLYAWYRDGAPTGITSETVTAAKTARGQTWQVRVKARFGTTETAEGTAQVLVLNTAPTCSAVVVGPGGATTTTELECSCTERTDPDDGDPVDDLCEWTVDGAPLGDAAQCTLDPTATQKGQSIGCTLHPADDDATGEPSAADPLTVANSAPSAPAVAISPAGGDVTTELTCQVTTAPTDADQETLTTEWSWLVNGSLVAGQESQTATPPSLGAAWGQTIQCRAIASDGEASSPLALSADWVVGNAAPVIEEPTLTPAEPTVLDTLTCAATATDPDGLSVDVTYSWTVDGKPVPGAAGTLAGAFVKGQHVVCTATASDGTATSQTLSSAPVTIVNAAPGAPEVLLVPAAADVQSMFECQIAAAATDPDEDTLSVTLSWWVDGVVVDGLAQASATAEALGATLGETVSCQAVASDGAALGPAGVSNPVTLGNAPPVAGTVQLGPVGATTTSTLTCEALDFSDPDDDEIDLSFAWTVNGEPVEGDTATLAGAFAKGDAVTCAAVASDGQLTHGDPIASAELVIANSVPTLGGATIESVSTGPCAALTCVAVELADDDASDQPAASWRWEKNGEPVEDATEAALTGVPLAPGDELACFATPGDGVATGTELGSLPVVITNELPVAGGVAVTPTVPLTGDLLTCTPWGLLDADCGDVGGAVSWYVGDTKLQTTEPTFDPSDYPAGTEIRCGFTPEDAFTEGELVLSQPVTLVAPPTEGATVVALALTGDALSTAECSFAQNAPAATTPVTWLWSLDGGEPFSAQSTLALPACARVTCQALIDLDGPITQTNTAELQADDAAACLDDGNACAVAQCHPLGGCVAATTAQDCDDGDACTTGDACKLGACTGQALSCDDGNPCTADLCEPSQGCLTAPLAAGACDDGDECTSGDSCQAGSCAGQPSCGCTAATDCDDLNPCTSATCVAGACVYEPLTTACDDADACTAGDTCQAGACVGQAIECTTWYLDEDGDGFGTDESICVCALPAGSSFVASVAGDCDDAAKAVHPTASELCDGVDTDCSGALDDVAEPPAAEVTDGVCAGATKVCAGALGWQEPNYGAIAGYEGQAELSCDGADNDCDGQIDDDFVCADPPEVIFGDFGDGWKIDGDTSGADYEVEVSGTIDEGPFAGTPVSGVAEKEGGGEPTWCVSGQTTLDLGLFQLEDVTLTVCAGNESWTLEGTLAVEGAKGAFTGTYTSADPWSLSLDVPAVELFGMSVSALDFDFQEGDSWVTVAGTATFPPADAALAISGQYVPSGDFELQASLADGESWRPLRGYDGLLLTAASGTLGREADAIEVSLGGSAAQPAWLAAGLTLESTTLAGAWADGSWTHTLTADAALGPWPEVALTGALTDDGATTSGCLSVQGPTDSPLLVLAQLSLANATGQLCFAGAAPSATLTLDAGLLGADYPTAQATLTLGGAPLTFAGQTTPAGAVQLASGTVLLPNGATLGADGALHAPDGFTEANGTWTSVDGVSFDSESGTLAWKTGLTHAVDGSYDLPQGETLPTGADSMAAGTFAAPEGAVLLPDYALYLPAEQTIRQPSGAVAAVENFGPPEGSLTLAAGAFQLPNGAVVDAGFDWLEGLAAWPGFDAASGSVTLADGTVVAPDGSAAGQAFVPASAPGWALALSIDALSLGAGGFALNDASVVAVDGGAFLTLDGALSASASGQSAALTLGGAVLADGSIAAALQLAPGATWSPLPGVVELTFDAIGGTFDADAAGTVTAWIRGESAGPHAVAGGAVTLSAVAVGPAALNDSEPVLVQATADLGLLGSAALTGTWDAQSTTLTLDGATSQALPGGTGGLQVALVANAAGIASLTLSGDAAFAPVGVVPVTGAWDPATGQVCVGGETGLSMPGSGTPLRVDLCSDLADAAGDFATATFSGTASAPTFGDVDLGGASDGTDLCLSGALSAEQQQAMDIDGVTLEELRAGSCYETAGLSDLELQAILTVGTGDTEITLLATGAFGAELELSLTMADFCWTPSGCTWASTCGAGEGCDQFWRPFASDPNAPAEVLALKFSGVTGTLTHSEAGTALEVVADATDDQIELVEGKWTLKKTFAVGTLTEDGSFEVLLGGQSTFSIALTDLPATLMGSFDVGSTMTFTGTIGNDKSYDVEPFSSIFGDGPISLGMGGSALTVTGDAESGWMKFGATVEMSVNLSGNDKTFTATLEYLHSDIAKRYTAGATLDDWSLEIGSESIPLGVSGKVLLMATNEPVNWDFDGDTWVLPKGLTIVGQGSLTKLLTSVLGDIGITWQATISGLKSFTFKSFLEMDWTLVGPNDDVPGLHSMTMDKIGIWLEIENKGGIKSPIWEIETRVGGTMDFVPEDRKGNVQEGLEASGWFVVDQTGAMGAELYITGFWKEPFLIPDMAIQSPAITLKLQASTAPLVLPTTFGFNGTMFFKKYGEWPEWIEVDGTGTAIGVPENLLTLGGTFYYDKVPSKSGVCPPKGECAILPPLLVRLNLQNITLSDVITMLNAVTGSAASIAGKIPGLSDLLDYLPDEALGDLDIDPFDIEITEALFYLSTHKQFLWNLQFVAGIRVKLAAALTTMNGNVKELLFDGFLSKSKLLLEARLSPFQVFDVVKVVGDPYRQAMKLNDGWLEIPDHDAFDAARTLEAWVKYAADGPATVLQKRSGEGAGFVLDVPADAPQCNGDPADCPEMGQLRLILSDGQDTRTVTTEYGVFEADVWHHVAVVMQDDGEVRVYVDKEEPALVDSAHGADGEADTEDDGAATLPGPNDAPLLVGQGLKLIDDVRVWETSRSSAELAGNASVLEGGGHDELDLISRHEFDYDEDDTPAYNTPLVTGADLHGTYVGGAEPTLLAGDDEQDLFFKLKLSKSVTSLQSNGVWFQAGLQVDLPLPDDLFDFKGRASAAISLGEAEGEYYVREFTLLTLPGIGEFQLSGNGPNGVEGDHDDGLYAGADFLASPAPTINASSRFGFLDHKSGDFTKISWSSFLFDCLKPAGCNDILDYTLQVSGDFKLTIPLPNNHGDLKIFDNQSHYSFDSDTMEMCVSSAVSLFGFDMAPSTELCINDQRIYWSSDFELGSQEGISFGKVFDMDLELQYDPLTFCGKNETILEIPLLGTSFVGLVDLCFGDSQYFKFYGSATVAKIKGFNLGQVTVSVDTGKGMTVTGELSIPGLFDSTVTGVVTTDGAYSLSGTAELTLGALIALNTTVTIDQNGASVAITLNEGKNNPWIEGTLSGSLAVDGGNVTFDLTGTGALNVGDWQLAGAELRISSADGVYAKVTVPLLNTAVEGYYDAGTNEFALAFSGDITVKGFTLASANVKVSNKTGLTVDNAKLSVPKIFDAEVSATLTSPTNFSFTGTASATLWSVVSASTSVTLTNNGLAVSTALNVGSGVVTADCGFSAQAGPVAGFDMSCTVDAIKIGNFTLAGGSVSFSNTGFAASGTLDLGILTTSVSAAVDDGNQALSFAGTIDAEIINLVDLDGSVTAGSSGAAFSGTLKAFGATVSTSGTFTNGSNWSLAASGAAPTINGVSVLNASFLLSNTNGSPSFTIEGQAGPSDLGLTVKGTATSSSMSLTGTVSISFDVIGKVVELLTVIINDATTAAKCGATWSADKVVCGVTTVIENVTVAFKNIGQCFQSISCTACCTKFWKCGKCKCSCDMKNDYTNSCGVKNGNKITDCSEENVLNEKHDFGWFAGTASVTLSTSSGLSGSFSGKYYWNNGNKSFDLGDQSFDTADWKICASIGENKLIDQAADFFGKLASTLDTGFSGSNPKMCHTF